MVHTDMAEPPLRMPFGSDTIRRIEAKNAFVAQELIRWRDVSGSIDSAPELAQVGESRD